MAIWMLAGADLRRRRATLAALVMLTAVVVGCALAAVAGARRTGSALERFFEDAGGSDVTVGVPASDDGGAAFLEALRRLPKVEAVAVSTGVMLTRVPVEGPPGPFVYEVDVLVAVDAAYGRRVNALRILEGRRADPSRVEEVTVDEELARNWRLRPGGMVHLAALAPEQAEAAFVPGVTAPEGPRFALQVVGVHRSPFELGRNLAVDGSLHATPALFERHQGQVVDFGLVANVRLRDGAREVPAFTRALQALPAGEEVEVSARRDVVADVQRSLDVQSSALVLFGLLAAVAGLLILGQLLARHVALGGDEFPTLRGLGMGTVELAATAMVPVAVVALAGTFLGIALALVASPLFPLGLARLAEPAPGLSVDATVLGLGALASVALVLSAGGYPGWQLAKGRSAASAAPRSPSNRGRIDANGSVVARAVGRVGLGPPAAVGVRLAFESGRGRTAVPVRSSIFVVVTALAALAAAAVFGASLVHLTRTPRLYGWDFDVDVPGDTAKVPRLAADPDVDAFSLAQFSETVTVDGHDFAGFGIRPIKGAVFPTLAEGRQPAGADEIVLGEQALRRLGRQVGDQVEVALGGTPRAMRIVGRGVVPGIERHPIVAEGAVMHADAFEQLQASASAEVPALSVFLVRLAEGVDTAAVVRRLEHDFGRVEQPVLPRDVQNLAQVRTAPYALAGLLAVLGAAALGHVVATSGARRRRDFAVLRSLGFTGQQLAATVVWQASSFVAVAVVVAVPVGVAVGRLAWHSVSQRIFVLPEAVIPTVSLVLGGMAALVIANLIGALPARAASRVSPAVVLRAE